MNSHISEDATRALDVLDWWCAWITAGDSHHLNLTDSAVINRIFNTGEVWVETAVKADHQRPFGLFYHFQTVLYALNAQVNRLLAEYRFTHLTELFDQICMGVSWGTDNYAVDVS